MLFLSKNQLHTFVPLGPWKFNPMFPFKVKRHIDTLTKSEINKTWHCSIAALKRTFGPGGPDGPGRPWITMEFTNEINYI